MNRIVKADTIPDGGAAKAAVLNMSDFAAEARDIVLGARKDAARIVAEARANADSIRREAHQQAYAEGLARGQGDGYTDGQQRAMAVVRKEFAGEYAELLSLARGAIDALPGARVDELRIACDEVIEMAVSLAEIIVGQVARDNLAPARENLVKALELAQVAGPLLVRVNPGQAEKLQEHFRELVEVMGASQDVHLVADERISPGGVKVSGPCGQIDATIETQLTNAANVLLGREPQITCDEDDGDEFGRYVRADESLGDQIGSTCVQLTPVAGIDENF